MTPSSSPVPRLMARSIVSSGTEVSRAFWNIVRSVGFVSGSPPPCAGRHLDLADQLGEELARALVGGALLVLDRGPLGMAGHQAPPPSRKQLVEPEVVGELRVEGGDDDGTLPARAPDGPRPRPAPRPVADPLDDGRPDEHGVERVAVERRRRSRSASNESTWRPKALRRTVDVDGAEAALVGAAVEDLARQQDHPGAGAEGGQPVGQALGQRLEQARATRAASTWWWTRRRA